MNITIESIGSVGSTTMLGGHTLVFDQPSSVPGGMDRGASPLDVFAAAAGGCAHYYAAAYLFGRKLPTEGLRLELHYEKSKERPARITTLTMQVHLPKGTDPAHQAGVERAIRGCPVLGTLLQSPTLRIEFEGVAPQAVSATL